MSKLDSTDISILRILQQDCSLTVKELAAQVNLTTTPVFERIKRLERDGVIKQYTVILDQEQIAVGFTVFCQVKLKRINQSLALDFAERVKQLPNVIECYNISGEFDYLLKIQVKDMRDYQHFILNELGCIETVGELRSCFVMDTLKWLAGYQI